MRPSRHRTACRTIGGVFALASILTACGDIAADLPAGAVDPKSYATPEAAMKLARGARYEYQIALLEYMLDAGRISDEFFDPDSANRLPSIYREISSTGTVNPSSYDVIVLDQRHLPDETLHQTEVGRHVSAIRSYDSLQTARTAAILAGRAVVAYIPEPQFSLRGELLAYEALAEIMLADLYCSGIPLSSADFGGDWTYRPGSRTQEVYEHALALADSALALTVSDPAILSLIRVSKGRALLALGRFEEAATAVRDVPTGFRFALPIMRADRKTANTPNGFSWDRTRRRGSIADRKGGNGLPFGSTTDPRIARTTASIPTRPVVVDRTHLQVASHIEARLIEAEADLRAGGTQWLTMLNTLRTSTGGVAGLPALTDPGLAPLPTSKTAFDVRVDLLFQERAYWLFFTGNRQGDLRRLLRHYDRTVQTVYPTGPSRGGFEAYDDYVDVPIPASERFNPYFTGCIARGE